MGNLYVEHVLPLCSCSFVVQFVSSFHPSSGTAHLSCNSRYRISLSTVIESGPNEPSGFRGRKELLNHASASVTTCP